MEFEIQHRISMLSVLILIAFWDSFGIVLGAKITFGCILGAYWETSEAPWEHLGSIMELTGAGNVSGYSF